MQESVNLAYYIVYFCGARRSRRFETCIVTENVKYIETRDSGRRRLDCSNWLLRRHGFAVRGYASPQETGENRQAKLLHGEGMHSLLRKGTCKHQVTTEISYTFHVRLIKW